VRLGGAALLSLLAITMAFAAAGQAKPRDGIPSWVGASEQEAVARLFGNTPPLVANFNIPSARRIVVVLEFQRVVVCRACSAPSNASRPHGRVVRMSFDRRTRRRTGSLRFCEVRGIKPPLGACLAR
jgi:hypothetical protein